MSARRRPAEPAQRHEAGAPAGRAAAFLRANAGRQQAGADGSRTSVADPAEPVNTCAKCGDTGLSRSLYAVAGEACVCPAGTQIVLAREDVRRAAQADADARHDASRAAFDARWAPLGREVSNADRQAWLQRDSAIARPAPAGVFARCGLQLVGFALTRTR